MEGSSFAAVSWEFVSYQSSVVGAAKDPAASSGYLLQIRAAASGMIVAVMDDFEAYGQLRDRPKLAAQDAAPPQTLTPRRKRSHWLRNLVLLALAYAALAVLTTLQPIAVPIVGARLSVPFPGGAPMLFGLPNRPYTVLVIGLDRRPTETGASRTDTLLLLRIDPGAHKAAFLSIPRDSLMEIPSQDGGFTKDRINTAYVYNYSSRDASAAPKATVQTIEHNLGINIDHYVVFDQRSSEKLIDALGGVTIDNPRGFGQADYSDDDVHVVPQQFAEGTITLDGYQAVAYGRIREGSTDFDRIVRQQRVGSALVHQAASPRSLLHLPSVWSAYRKTINTDMSMRQSAGVFSMLKRVPDSDLKTKSLGDAAVSCTTCTASIQLLDPGRVRQIVDDAFGDQQSGERAAELLVAAGVTP
ncbi:MAG: LCP family protein [Chloroflexota bacterium]|nr:LCP family protein [Chloroflexota bacterium]